MTVVAVVLAATAALLFASAINLQHDAVQAEGTTSITRLTRSPRWLVGGALALTGSGLHVLALSMAPVAVVQPVGVLSLVATILLGRLRRTIAWTRHVRLGVAVTSLGTAGFVLTSTGASTAAPAVLPVALAAGAAGLLALAGRRAGRRVRCVTASLATALLFGSGATLIKAGLGTLLSGTALLLGLGFVAAAAALLAVGAASLQQAHAAGSPAVVVAVTTVVDPMTAVLLSGGLAAATGLLSLQLIFAGLAVAGVALLSRVVPDPQSHRNEIPDRTHPGGNMTDPSTDPGRPLRVLIAADTYAPDINGAAQFAVRLSDGLARRGHHVHVVCPGTDAESASSHEDVTVDRVPAIRTPFHPTFRISTPRQATLTVSTVLDLVQPDVVHAQSHFAVGRAALRGARGRGIPAVATNHFMPDNLIGYAPVPEWLRGPVSRWAWADLMRVYRYADQVTAPTPRAVQLLHDNGLQQSALAVSCGIDVEHYRAVRDLPAADEPTLTVLFVGRLDAEKHVDELLRALAALPPAVRCAVQADIVGDGMCRAQLEQLSGGLGLGDRVHFRGFVSAEELVTAYREADVFCMPGTAELQSLATMEAMSAGLPILAADAMALPHLVQPGRNGFLFQPTNITQLAAQLEVLAQDPSGRLAMGRQSLELVAPHAETRSLDTFEHIYRNVLRRPPRTETYQQTRPQPSLPNLRVPSPADGGI